MKLKILALPALLAIAVLAFGCGSDDSSSDTTASSTSSTAASGESAEVEADEASSTAPVAGAADNVIDVKMSEFAFDPSTITSKAGPATISATNEGNVVHELVVLKTDADPAKLPTAGGEIDESTSVGEVADVAPGATKEATIDLAAGKYVMVCALPGHYEGGMYGSLTVK